MNTVLQELTVDALFDLSHTQAAPLLTQATYPWEILDKLGGFIQSLGETLGECYRSPAPRVWVHESAKVAPTAFLGENVIIGPETEIRHGAFIRGNALVGAGAVVGNSTELKNVILFDKVQVPHYNYVGDSVLGYKAHLGAGAITSNIKSDKTLVAVHDGKRDLPTGRKKLGAMVGDWVEVGCGSVLNPGTVIGRGTRVYPLSAVRGYLPPDSIYKKQGEIAAQIER